MSRAIKNLAWLSLSLAVVCVDQLTKLWADATLNYFQPQPVFAFLNFTLSYNTGAAFGFLNMAGGWQRWFFIAIAVMAVLALTAWLLRLKPQQKLLALALALVLGGAIGNAIDRLALGYVRDFIDVYVRHWHFAFFNVADAAISVGAALIIFDVIFVQDGRI